MKEFTSIILAAGMGTRMKSDMPKVLHKVCGKELVRWVIDASKKAGAKKVVTVIGHKAEMVKDILGDACEYAIQAEQKGTGHALMQAASFIDDGYVMVLTGDAPLICDETMKAAVEYHENSKNSATVITAILDDATGYGRIVRDTNQNVLKIVEQKDATDAQKKIREINSGMYVFDGKDLLNALDKLQPNNAQGEYYLTDTLEILRNEGKKIGGFAISDNDEIRGINDRVQLAEAEAIMQKRLINHHMKNGVTFILPQTTIIEDNVEIGNDTIVYPDVYIKSGTQIGAGCVIGKGSEITASKIGNRVTINNSVLLNCEIDDDTTVGPFAYIRPDTKVGKRARIGDFVELKNSNIGDGTKVSHLTYVGDSDVGERVNFGCGTVTVNYDGKKKYRTTIGDDCFIGCNTNLVAPVKIESGAYTAAGSTITDDVPADSLAIARARQVIKTEWKDRRKQ